MLSKVSDDMYGICCLLPSCPVNHQYDWLVFFCFNQQSGFNVLASANRCLGSHDPFKNIGKVVCVRFILVVCKVHNAALLTLSATIIEPVLYK